VAGRGVAPLPTAPPRVATDRVASFVTKPPRTPPPLPRSPRVSLPLHGAEAPCREPKPSDLPERLPGEIPPTTAERALISTIAAAVILGSFAGLAPGPYTTMVAGTALEKGFRAGLRLAFAPLATDIVPMLLTAVVLDRLSWTALTVLGIAGGVLIGAVGVRFLRRHGRTYGRGGTGPSPLGGQSATFGHVVLTTILSPAPWLFWLVVASPLLLRSWARSPGEGIAFASALFATNIATASGLAWVASRGRRRIPVLWRGRVLSAVGVGLVLAGVVLVWQSMTGNFQALIDRQHLLRSTVEEQTSLGDGSPWESAGSYRPGGSGG